MCNPDKINDCSTPTITSRSSSLATVVVTHSEGVDDILLICSELGKSAKKNKTEGFSSMTNMREIDKTDEILRHGDSLQSPQKENEGILKLTNFCMAPSGPSQRARISFGVYALN